LRSWRDGWRHLSFMMLMCPRWTLIIPGLLLMMLGLLIGLAVAFRPLLLSVGVFVLIVVLSRYVSLGSIMATLSFPVLVLLFHGRPETAVWGIAIASLVIIKHSGNIRRLLEGRERKFGERVS